MYSRRNTFGVSRKRFVVLVFGVESLFSDLIMFLQTIDSLSVLGLNLKLKLKLLSVGPLNNNSRLLLILLPVASLDEVGKLDAAVIKVSLMYFLFLHLPHLIVLDLSSVHQPLLHQLH